MALEATRLRLVDGHLPGSAAMLEDVPGPLAAALSVAGSRVEKAEPVQITWWPGKELTVRYRVEADGGKLAGRRQAVVVAGRIPEGAMRVEGDEATLGVWVVPNDPALPGLRSATDLAAVSSLLERQGGRGPVLDLKLRAYRPTRRAVVQVVTSHESIYLKVVRPSRVEALHANHRHLASHLPVPESLGVDIGKGIVVLSTLPGTDLRTALRTGGRLPSPLEIAGLLDLLPEPLDHPDTDSPIDAAVHVADLLRRIVPEVQDRIDALLETIGPETEDATVAAHRDFHEAQIMAVDGRLSGLLDVDTYGWGRPGDDPATMLAHLHLLAVGSADSDGIVQHARGLQKVWDTLVDPADLRRRVAAVILGLATGPFRVQRPNWPTEVSRRLEVADGWAQSSTRVDGRTSSL